MNDTVMLNRQTGVIVRVCTVCKGSGLLLGPDPDGDYDDWEATCGYCHGCGSLVDCVDDMCFDEDMDGWCQ